jgi:hypothetical protein
MAINATRVRAVVAAAARLVARSDVAIAYGAVVVTVTIALQFMPASRQHDIVERCSTNLANLRDHPLYVLLVSAFVVPSMWGLWIIPWLLVGYAAAQRWVGRVATIFVGLLGHVGATLFVAVLLTAGLWHGFVSRTVVHASDVGVSYGLACITAFLVGELPRRYRGVYTIVLTVFFGARLVIHHTFSDVGHATALLIGFGVALVATRVAVAERRRRDDAVIAT